MSIIRISVSDDWTVDYDTERGMYRVSYFEDGHFVDDHWFDAYEDKELDKSFPQTIGNITYYSKAELFEWVENQQKINETYQIKLEVPQPEVEKLMMDMFGSLNIGVLDCSDMSEEEINRIADEFNKIPN